MLIGYPIEQKTQGEPGYRMWINLDKPSVWINSVFKDITSKEASFERSGMIWEENQGMTLPVP